MMGEKRMNNEQLDKRLEAAKAECHCETQDYPGMHWPWCPRSDVYQQRTNVMSAEKRGASFNQDVQDYVDEAEKAIEKMRADQTKAKAFAERTKDWGPLAEEWDDVAETGNLARAYLTLEQEIVNLRRALAVLREQAKQSDHCDDAGDCWVASDHIVMIVDAALARKETLPSELAAECLDAADAECGGWTTVSKAASSVVLKHITAAITVERARAKSIVDAATDLVTLWQHMKIDGLPRAERNAAIEETRERLIAAVRAAPGTEAGQIRCAHDWLRHLAADGTTVVYQKCVRCGLEE